MRVQGLTYKDYGRETRPTLHMEQNLHYVANVIDLTAPLLEVEAILTFDVQQREQMLTPQDVTKWFLKPPSWLLQIQPCWLVVLPFWFRPKNYGHGRPPAYWFLRVHSDFEALLHLQLSICISNIITYNSVSICHK